jgi:hypothetical protein
LIMTKWIRTYLLENDSSKIGNVLRRFGIHMMELQEAHPLNEFKISIVGKAIPEREFEGKIKNFEVSIEVEHE